MIIPGAPELEDPDLALRAVVGTITSGDGVSGVIACVSCLLVARAIRTARHIWWSP